MATCGGDSHEDYDWPLHIAAPFIILAGTIIGICMPVLSKWKQSFRVNDYVFTVFKAFGTGIIMASGFVHMFPEASAKLSSPCLPAEFSTFFPAYAGLFAMLSALAMHCGQTFATHYAKDRHLKRCESAQTLLSTDTNDADAPVHSHMIDMSGTERMITALTLEAGITIHALLTGVTLGVVGGTSFVSFLIAVAFHQIFESFAVAVTAIEAGFGLKKTLLTMLPYTLATPVGICIGMALSRTFNENAETALLVQGTFEAVASGILFYDVFVNLVAVNFAHQAEFASLSIRRKLGILGAMWAGAGILSLMGRWA